MNLITPEAVSDLCGSHAPAWCRRRRLAGPSSMHARMGAAAIGSLLTACGSLRSVQTACLPIQCLEPTPVHQPHAVPPALGTARAPPPPLQPRCCCQGAAHATRHPSSLRRDLAGRVWRVQRGKMPCPQPAVWLAAAAHHEMGCTDRRFPGQMGKAACLLQPKGQCQASQSSHSCRKTVLRLPGSLPTPRCTAPNKAPRCGREQRRGWGGGIRVLQKTGANPISESKAG